METTVFEDENFTGVDTFTSDLFFNFTVSNYDNLLPSATDSEKFDALVQDAAEFIEVVGNHFGGVSIDWEAEEYAKDFLNRV